MRPNRVFLWCVVALVCLPITASAATWYVRTDGGAYGTTSTTCNGLTNAGYSAGNGPNCAVNHLFEILGVDYPGAYGFSSIREQRVSAGDTIIIANGTYQTGYIAGTYANQACSSDNPGECYNLAVPNGLKIYGAEYSSGCTTKPVLSGTGGTRRVLNLGSASNVDVRCIEITDQEDCGAGIGTNPCVNAATTPYGRNGIYAYNGSNNSLTNVNIHGMANSGVWAGRQTNWTMTDVIIRGNNFAGIDMDTATGNDGWSGDNVFTRVTVEWSGCAENYPVDGGYNNCTDQNNGGYGDALGSPSSGTGGNFTFTDTVWRYNVSDAIDLLYITATGTSIVAERNYFEGNVGNCLKIGAQNAIVRNNVFIHNCDYFSLVSGKNAGFSTCRGYDGAIVNGNLPTRNWDIVNNTFVSQGDSLMTLSKCDGAENINVKNNLIHGYTQWNDTGDKVSWWYGYNGCGSPNSASNNIIYNVKQENPCSSTGSGAYVQSNCLESDPRLATVNFTTHTFDPAILVAAPGRDYGLSVGATVGQTTVPVVDYNSFSRGSGAVDLGALEYGSASGSTPTRRATGGGTIAGN